jgi:hypothetical protein
MQRVKTEFKSFVFWIYLIALTAKVIYHTMGNGRNMNAEFCKTTEMHLMQNYLFISSTTFSKAFPIQE